MTLCGCGLVLSFKSVDHLFCHSLDLCHCVTYYLSDLMYSTLKIVICKLMYSTLKMICENGEVFEKW
jgi:hypothetical protein